MINVRINNRYVENELLDRIDRNRNRDLFKRSGLDRDIFNDEFTRIGVMYRIFNEYDVDNIESDITYYDYDTKARILTKEDNAHSLMMKYMLKV